MNFIFFRPQKAKKFNYVPRFYDPDKELWEKRKAELGLLDDLDGQNDLRRKIQARWHRKTHETGKDKVRSFSLAIGIATVFISLYLIFFTHLIDNILLAFGLMK